MRELQMEDLPEEERVGDYALGLPLGRGAMGRVFRARHVETGRSAAVKILNPDLMGQGEAFERFRREAEHAREVRHENVARVFDGGVDAKGRPYIVMEAVNGPTLEKMIREKTALPLSQKIDLALQTCEGLRAALQQKSLIHCDLKPANLIVDSETRLLKILDFGIGRVVWEAFPHAQPQLEAAGTPRYMAPEQCRPGGGVDLRADIWAVGASFYHFLAGQPPFDAETDAELMELHATATPTPIQEINPDLPQDLCEIINRMVARDPNERYQDYATLIADLDAAKLAALARSGRKSAPGVPIPDEHADFGSASAPSEPPPEEGIFDDLSEIGVAGAAAQRSAPRPPETEDDQLRPATGANYHEDQHPHATNVHDLGQGKRLEALSKVKVREARRGRFHPVVLVLALFLAVFLVVALFVPWGDPNAEGERVSLLRSLGRDFIGMLFPAATRPAVDPLIAEYGRNVDRLEDVARGVRNFYAREGRWPNSIREVVDEGALTEEEARDAWSGLVRLYTTRQIIRSYGKDGIENTEDDWDMRFRGGLLNSPAEYRQFLEEGQYERGVSL